MLPVLVPLLSELKRKKKNRISDWSLWLPLTECVELQHGRVKRMNVPFKGGEGSHSEGGAATAGQRVEFLYAY